tara:strand:+ start:95 stop:556 length:462 start_codon:yes stop_codon:yes gene_type:complete
VKKIILIKHLAGAPGLSLFGLGPRLTPVNAVDQLKDLFESQSFWAKGRKKKELKKMIKNSSCVITIWQGNRLIGFGRATSDCIYRAVLWDIVIAKDHQNSGLGKLLVKSLLSSHSIKDVEKVYLMTTNSKDFYKTCKFKEIKTQSLLINQKYS